MENTQRPNLWQKLFKVQVDMETAKKSSENPHFRSQYADLNEIYRVSKQQLNNNRLKVDHQFSVQNGNSYLETRIIDIDSPTGEGISSGPMPLLGVDNMQKLTGASTYARRATLGALLAIVTETDDDGETAVGRGTVAPAKTAPRTVATPGLEETLKLITSKVRVVVAKNKTVTKETMTQYIQDKYGVDTKEKLNPTQAKELLTYVEGLLV